MSMSLNRKKKIRKKVVNPYYSLVLLLIIMISQWCAKLKPPWVLLSKHLSDFFQNIVGWLFKPSLDSVYESNCLAHV